MVTQPLPVVADRPNVAGLMHGRRWPLTTSAPPDFAPHGTVEAEQLRQVVECLDRLRRKACDEEEPI